MIAENERLRPGRLSHRDAKRIMEEFLQIPRAEFDARPQNWPDRIPWSCTSTDLPQTDLFLMNVLTGYFKGDLRLVILRQRAELHKPLSRILRRLSRMDPGVAEIRSIVDAQDKSDLDCPCFRDHVAALEDGVANLREHCEARLEEAARNREILKRFKRRRGAGRRRGDIAPAWLFLIAAKRVLKCEMPRARRIRGPLLEFIKAHASLLGVKSESEILARELKSASGRTWSDYAKEGERAAERYRRGESGQAFAQLLDAYPRSSNYAGLGIVNETDWG